MRSYLKRYKNVNRHSKNLAYGTKNRQTCHKYIKADYLTKTWYWTRNAGTAIARYETRKTCKNYCDWEIGKLHVGNAFEREGDGQIRIKQTGYYSIIAQLHNKHGNNGYWMRTNIKVNGSVKSKRYTTYLSQSN